MAQLFLTNIRTADYLLERHLAKEGKNVKNKSTGQKVQASPSGASSQIFGRSMGDIRSAAVAYRTCLPDDKATKRDLLFDALTDIVTYTQLQEFHHTFFRNNPAAAAYLSTIRGRADPRGARLYPEKQRARFCVTTSFDYPPIDPTGPEPLRLSQLVRQQHPYISEEFLRFWLIPKERHDYLFGGILPCVPIWKRLSAVTPKALTTKDAGKMRCIWASGETEYFRPQLVDVLIGGVENVDCVYEEDVLAHCAIESGAISQTVADLQKSISTDSRYVGYALKAEESKVDEDVRRKFYECSDLQEVEIEAGNCTPVRLIIMGIAYLTVQKDAGTIVHYVFPGCVPQHEQDAIRASISDMRETVSVSFTNGTLPVEDLEAWTNALLQSDSNLPREKTFSYRAAKSCAGRGPVFVVDGTRCFAETTEQAQPLYEAYGLQKQTNEFRRVRLTPSNVTLSSIEHPTALSYWMDSMDAANIAAFLSDPENDGRRWRNYLEYWMTVELPKLLVLHPHKKEITRSCVQKTAPFTNMDKVQCVWKSTLLQVLPTDVPIFHFPPHVEPSMHSPASYTTFGIAAVARPRNSVSTYVQTGHDDDRPIPIITLKDPQDVELYLGPDNAIICNWANVSLQQAPAMNVEATPLAAVPVITVAVNPAGVLSVDSAPDGSVDVAKSVGASATLAVTSVSLCLASVAEASSCPTAAEASPCPPAEKEEKPLRSQGSRQARLILTTRKQPLSKK